MKKKLSVIALVLVVILTAFVSCGESQEPNITEQQQTSADGYETLKGTWYVGAIYYKNKLIDISDNDALSDLYDTTFIAFREDGTFTYSDIYIRDGKYIRKESIGGKETFLLKTERVYTYNLVEGKMVENDIEDGTKTSYLLTVTSADTIEVVEMDPMTGKAKSGESPFVFEPSGEESDYISSNKTEIKTTAQSQTTTKTYPTTERTTAYTTTKSYYSGGSSAGQRNALQSAKNYLSVMPFSYKGLIEQLEYEGYSNSEATYAADNCGADWYEQAEKCAANYLDTMPFSRSDLIAQLEYEGFTHSQAVHGVDVAYN